MCGRGAEFIYDIMENRFGRDRGRMQISVWRALREVRPGREQRGGHGWRWVTSRDRER